MKIFGKSILIVTTGSMKPEIDIGELIIINEEKKYYEGDIVTYEDEEGFVVTHRIYKLENNFIITKGDNNDLLDEKMSIDNIKGKVVFHSKILGFFAMYLLKPLLCIYVFIITIFYLINTYFREEKVENEKSNNDSND